MLIHPCFLCCTAILHLLRHVVGVSAHHVHLGQLVSHANNLHVTAELLRRTAQVCAALGRLGTIRSGTQRHSTRVSVLICVYISKMSIIIIIIIIIIINVN